jgi:hypothetical protein
MLLFYTDINLISLPFKSFQGTFKIVMFMTRFESMDANECDEQ